jgi:hypothetical protein
VAAAGKCAPIIAATCKDVEAGQGRLAQCVSEVLAAADAGTENEAGGMHDTETSASAFYRLLPGSGSTAAKASWHKTKQHGGTWSMVHRPKAAAVS